VSWLEYGSRQYLFLTRKSAKWRNYYFYFIMLRQCINNWVHVESHDERSVSYLSKSLYYLKRTRCITFIDGGWLCVTNWAGGEYYILYYIKFSLEGFVKIIKTWFRISGYLTKNRDFKYSSYMTETQSTFITKTNRLM